MGCMNEEEQEDEILALSEILPPSTLTVERLGPASHSGSVQVLYFRIRICSTTIFVLDGVQDPVLKS
jgi:hypothetical protein